MLDVFWNRVVRRVNNGILGSHIWGLLFRRKNVSLVSYSGCRPSGTDWFEGLVTEYLVATFGDYFGDVKLWVRSPLKCTLLSVLPLSFHPVLSHCYSLCRRYFVVPFICCFSALKALRCRIAWFARWSNTDIVPKMGYKGCITVPSSSIAWSSEYCTHHTCF